LVGGDPLAFDEGSMGLADHFAGGQGGLLPRLYPAQWAAIAGLAKDERVWTDKQYRLGTATTDLDFIDRQNFILYIGAYQQTVSRRDLPIPSIFPRACALCGEGFQEADIYPKWVKQFANLRYCTRCLMAAWEGSAKVKDREIIFEALRGIATELGPYLPPDSAGNRCPARLRTTCAIGWSRTS
jgi:hypothetical protein